jgi:hypothetical protein
MRQPCGGSARPPACVPVVSRCPGRS